MPPEALAAPDSRAERVHEAIEAILARPEFAPPPRPLLARVRDLVVERLAALLEAVGTTGSGAAVGWVVVAVLAAAAVVLAVRFSRGMRSDPERIPGPVAEAARGAPNWRAEAAAHEAAGRWRAALRCRWRALVADLAGRGLLEEAPGRTAGEYRRQLARVAPPAALDFDAATAIFEDAWYGHRPADAALAQRFRELSARVLEARS